MKKLLACAVILTTLLTPVTSFANYSFDDGWERLPEKEVGYKTGYQVEPRYTRINTTYSTSKVIEIGTYRNIIHDHNRQQYFYKSWYLPIEVLEILGYKAINAHLPGADLKGDIVLQNGYMPPDFRIESIDGKEVYTFAPDTTEYEDGYYLMYKQTRNVDGSLSVKTLQSNAVGFGTGNLHVTEQNTPQWDYRKVSGAQQDTIRFINLRLIRELGHDSILIRNEFTASYTDQEGLSRTWQKPTIHRIVIEPNERMKLSNRERVLNSQAMEAVGKSVLMSNTEHVEHLKKEGKKVVTIEYVGSIDFQGNFFREEGLEKITDTKRLTDMFIFRSSEGIYVFSPQRFLQKDLSLN